MEIIKKIRMRPEDNDSMIEAYFAMTVVLVVKSYCQGLCFICKVCCKKLNASQISVGSTIHVPTPNVLQQKVIPCTVNIGPLFQLRKQQWLHP